MSAKPKLSAGDLWASLTRQADEAKNAPKAAPGGPPKGKVLLLSEVYDGRDKAGNVNPRKAGTFLRVFFSAEDTAVRDALMQGAWAKGFRAYGWVGPKGSNIPKTQGVSMALKPETLTYVRETLTAAGLEAIA